MSYPSFPSIPKPSYDGSNRDEYPEWDDAVIASKAGGYEITRPRNTRLQMGHTWVWPLMSEADYTTLKSFILNTICYAGTFVWTDPKTGATSNQRLIARPDAYQDNLYWHVTLTMREV